MLVFHCREEKVVQVVVVEYPPQMVRLVMVCPILSYGREGRVQDMPKEGEHTSTLVRYGLPPDSSRPKYVCMVI